MLQRTILILGFSIAALTMLSGCQSIRSSIENSTTLQIPQDAKRILIVDRHKNGIPLLFGKRPDWVNQLDSNSNDLLKDGINSLSSADSTQYEYIFLAESLPEASGESELRDWPAALEAEEVIMLCKKYGADALIAVELIASNYNQFSYTEDDSPELQGQSAYWLTIGAGCRSYSATSGEVIDWVTASGELEQTSHKWIKPGELVSGSFDALAHNLVQALSIDDKSEQVSL